MGIVYGTLETGVGYAASSRACRSSVFLRSSSRQLAMNRTAPCSTIPLPTWSLHAACNQPSSGIPNAFRSSFRHSHQYFTFRPRLFSTRPTFMNVPCNRCFGNLWLPIRCMRPASRKRSLRTVVSIDSQPVFSRADRYEREWSVRFFMRKPVHHSSRRRCCVRRKSHSSWRSAPDLRAEHFHLQL